MVKAHNDNDKLHGKYQQWDNDGKLKIECYSSQAQLIIMEYRKENDPASCACDVSFSLHNYDL